MDLEKLWTLSVITIITFIFISIVCWTKYKIEKKFRKNSEHIKKTKIRMKKVSYQETVLCKKVLCESTNRHQRSIIASSLMHTLDEELQRLQHITDSIRQVQAFPKMMSNFYHIDANFLKDFGASAKTYNKEERLAECENNNFRKDYNPLQSKLCETWRDHAKKQLKTDEKHIGSRRSKKNNSMYKSPKRINFLQTIKTRPQSQQNVVMTKNTNSRFQIMRHAMTKNKRLQEVIFNPSFKSNFKISTSVWEKSGNTNSMDSSKNSPCVDLKFPTTDKRFKIKRSSYTCPGEIQHTEGTRIHLEKEDYSNSTNTAVKQLDEESEISLDRYKAEYQSQNIKIKVPKNTFEIDLICHDKDSITKRRIAHSAKNTGNIVKSIIKLIKYKKQKICTLGKSGFSSCILKVPIKMPKKEIIIKFIFSLILKDKLFKRKKYYWQSNVIKPILSVKNLTKMPSKCTINSNKRLEHKKILSKKHTIYTSSDQCADKIKNDVTFPNLDTFMTFADGDTALPLCTTKSIDNLTPFVTDQNKHDSWLDYSSTNQNSLEGKAIIQQCIELTKRRICSNKAAVTKHEGQSDFESENHSASTYNYILQQCIELTQDCLKDSSIISFDYKSLLAYDISNDKTILTTIEEEPAEDISDLNGNTSGGKHKNSLINSKNASVFTENTNNLKIFTGDLMNFYDNSITFSDLASFNRNLENANSQRSTSRDESETSLQLISYNTDSCAYDEDKNESTEAIPENLFTTDTSTKLESNQNEVRMLGYSFEIKHLGESNYSKILTNEDFDSFHEMSTQLVTSNYQMRQLFFRNDCSMYSISEHSWQSDSQRINNNPSRWTFQEIEIGESIVEDIQSQNYLVLNESHVRLQGSNKQFDASLLEGKLFFSANHDLVTDFSNRKTDKIEAKEELECLQNKEDNKK